MLRSHFVRICWLVASLTLVESTQAQQGTQSARFGAQEVAAVVATKEQEADIRALIEQLVYEKPEPAGKANSRTAPEDANDQRARFKRCQEAFTKLSEYKELAFPILLEHLNDNRPSIPFRNHYAECSVGHACYWNLYYQLQDRPEGYSRYGYQRKGRDGEDHVLPYWEGTPFDAVGGLEKWLENHKDLTYTQKQIKCLEWLLAEEMKIGAADAESYFVNILPLEIQIVRRRLERGEDVAEELERLERRQKEKLVAEIPADLLPLAPTLQ